MKPILRVETMLAGEPVDRAPFCLYPQYDLDLLAGDVLASAVEAFVERYEPDVVAVPRCFDYTMPPNLSLDRASDLARFELVHGRHGDWGHQQDAIRRVCRTFFGKRWVAAVVPSAWTQLHRLAGGRFLQEALRENSGFLWQALDVLTRSLCAFNRQAIESGVNMILVEETGASHEVMEPVLYRDKVLPLLQQQLSSTGKVLSVAQFLGRRLYWDECPLQCSGIGWPIEAGPGFARGAKRIQGFAWGGLDTTLWADASSAWLRGSLRQQLTDLPTTPFILAPPTGISKIRPDQLEALAFGLRRLPSPERLRETPEEMEARRAATPPKPRKHKEEREPFVPILREAPKPAKGARTRLHGKSSPEEPLLPPEPEL